jgi:chemotaxis protein methyltransferase WspC
MNVAAIETWLHQHCGLESSSLGPGVVARAARARAAALGCAEAEEYLDRLAGSPEERQWLIDRVVVAETWFFRDPAAIEAVARHAAGPWNEAHPGEIFRILCVPCSTGEEPYSLAIAFEQVGWPPARLAIEAVDISRGNIAAARVGRYGKNSFRGPDSLYRDLYLDPAGTEAWRVRDGLRAPVAFAEGNLLADDFGAGRGPYDAIFCRNLLIYFDGGMQARAIAALGRLLAPDGWFAVGPAEPVLLFAHGFSALKIASGFLLQRAPPVPEATAPVTSPPRPRRVSPPPAVPAAKPRISHPKSAAPASAPDTLEAIRSLADSGQLAAAATRASALLARDGASPALLYLLGLIADARGEPARATEFYRKTLYLDPQHGDALAQLAGQAERSGDLRAARAWRARAGRALHREPAA